MLRRLHMPILTFCVAATTVLAGIAVWQRSAPPDYAMNLPLPEPVFAELTEPSPTPPLNVVSTPGARGPLPDLSLPQPQVCALPPGMTFEFSAEVPLDERRLAECAAAQTVQYLSEAELGHPGAVTLFLSKDLGYLTDRSYAAFGASMARTADDFTTYWSWGSGSLSGLGADGAGVIILSMRHPRWEQLRRWVIAQELFQIVEARLACQPIQPISLSVTTAGPAWLIKGSAAIIADHVTGAAQGPMYQSAISEVFEDMPQNVTLETLATSREAGTLLYPAGTAAANLLVTLSPRGQEVGLAVIGDYYVGLCQGLSPEQSFEQAFGWTLPTFYETFEARRQTVLLGQ